MYEAFFGLREKPFSLLPDPSFLFLSQKHQEALTLLEYGLLNQAGFIVLTGEIGAGKTTLMRYLLNRLDPDVTVGLISHAHQSLGELTEWICLAFDIRVAGGSKLDQHQAFIDFLIGQYAKGKRVLLIVDEAQNLGVEKLEELRLLSNINADKDLVLQMMLLGQPQLRKLLHHSDLEQFVQRIAASYHLGRLTVLETQNYIRHRIFVAGGKYEIFSKDACHAIHHYTNGIPRLINLICDMAMVYAYGGGERRITGTAIDEFIASHAPHLLIQIDRDETGMPLPRERLHEEDSADTDDRTTTARTLGLATAPQDDSVGVRKAESPPADDSPGLVMESPPAMAPDQPGIVWTRTQGEPIPPTAGAPQPGAVPLRSFESQGVEADAAVDPLPEGGSGAVVEAGPVLRPNVARLPSDTLVAGVATKRPPGQKRGRVIGLLLALLVLVATGLSVFRLGWLSTSDQGRSAVTDRPQDDGSSNRNAASGVDPAGLQAAKRTLASPLRAPIADQLPVRPEGTSVPEPGTDSPAKQPPRQELDSGIGQDKAAVTPDSPVSAQQVQTADRQVPAVPPSAPAHRSDPPSLPIAGDLATTTSDSTPVAPSAVGSGPGTETVSSNSTPVAPTDAGSGPGIETVSSNVSAGTVAPDPQIPLPMPATVDSRTDGASGGRIADREAPRADPDGDRMGQLERQLKGLSLDVKKQDDRLVANLGRSVRFSDGSAVLNASSREALKRIADLLKDPMNVKVRVIGHTDSSGSEFLNQRLSDLRARVVIRYLAANGVSVARLTHQGRGKSEPKVAAEQEQIQGPEINRRIELEVFGPDRNPD